MMNQAAISEEESSEDAVIIDDKYKHLKNQYWSRVFKVERESDLTEAKYSLQHDVANAIMNIELIEIEYQIESEVIFNPDLIQDPPAGANIEDYILDADLLMEYGNMAAMIRKGFQNHRESLILQENIIVP